MRRDDLLQANDDHDGLDAERGVCRTESRGPCDAASRKDDAGPTPSPAPDSSKPAAAPVDVARPAPSPAAVAPSDPIQLFDQFAILGTAGGYLNSQEFLKFISDAEQGVKSKGLFEGRGPLAILLLVFFGGLALNLTPCVLPMIPVNLAIIGAGTGRSGRSRGFLLGAVYGGAMALVYGVLGLIVILTAGTFGTINASPWFNLGIAALFVVLGLAMFDVIMVDFTRFRSGLRLGETGRGTLWLAFSMGAIAALLAGACVAPVVIQVVVFASNLHASGTSIALALPFILGLGMGLPWPIAGAGLASLPKPGMWMVRVKQAMGVLILATAVYYAYIAYGIFANRWVNPAAVEASVAEKLKEGWHSSLADGPPRRASGEHAGHHRLLGHLVQELRRDGRDDAERSGGEGGARWLHADQVPGRRSGGLSRQGPDAAHRRRGAAGVCDLETESAP